MANLIDTSYFVNEISVAQVDYLPVATSLTEFITKYEPIYSSRVLGKQLYDDFIAGLAEPIIDQKWLNLRDGAAYTDGCGNLTEWTGFVNDEKTSPIAFYVYRQWLNNSAQTTTGAGQATIETENAVRANIVQKVIVIWNQMVELNINLAGFIKANSADYGTYKPYYEGQYYYYGCPNELFHYLNYLDI